MESICRRQIEQQNNISVFNRIENIVGKGENAGYQHFLRYPQCFQKACFSGASKGVTVWEWVKFGICVRVENIVRKEEHICQRKICPS